MSGRLFYTLAIGFTSGILARSFFVVEYPVVLLVLLVVVAVLVVWHRAGVSRASLGMLGALCVVAATFGVLRYELAIWSADRAALDHVAGQSIVVEGLVSREVDVRERSSHVTVTIDAIDGVPATGRVLVTTDRLRDVAYGDRVRVRGALTVPQEFETDLGRTFRYPEYLAARGIYHTMSFADIAVLNRGEGSRVLAFLYAAKHAFMGSIERMLPEPQAGLGEGLLLGAKRAIGADLESAFRTTGVIHIVVLSGYNITIVAEAVMRVLALFFMPRTRFLIGAVVIVGFAVLVGLSATVVRASLMALLVLVARATGKTYAVLRALVFSACVMLLLNPYLLAFDPGFQLSFLATFGLIFLAPMIESRLAFLPSTLQLREFATATLATQLFVLPLLLFSVGELSLVAVFANMAILVAVPLAMLATFVTGVLGLVAGWLALPVALIAQLLLSYIVSAASVFAALPYASVAVPVFPLWAMAGSYALMGAAFVWWARRHSPRVTMEMA